jgi:signal transduction histidine kinase
LRRHDGEYRYFLARAVAVRNDAGEVERWLGSSTEIHDQKMAEEALRRSEKLAAAGSLAASLAHEINNPLNSVVNMVYLALQDNTLSESTRRLLDGADSELTRVAQFTTQTLRFHKQSNAPTPVDLGEIMESVFAMYAPRLRTSSVHLERDYRTTEKLCCFNSELRQVFANLIGNSLDAIGRDGQIRVRIRASRSWLEGQPGIRVLVADTGHGIPAALRKRVFEPFMSTKEVTGMGLGLWVTDGIIKKHKGRIALRSSTDPLRHGTVFSMFFPLDGPLN